MGCSPDFEMSAEDIREEKRRYRLQKEIRKVPLKALSVGDVLELLNVFRPSYPLHVWCKDDSDTVQRILNKVPNSCKF